MTSGLARLRTTTGRGCERMGHGRDAMLTIFGVVMKSLSVRDLIIVHQETDEADEVAGRTANREHIYGRKRMTLESVSHASRSAFACRVSSRSGHHACCEIFMGGGW